MSEDDRDKAQLEAILLRAQVEKIRAEIAVLRKTTPFSESLKIFGSLVVGIGGAIVALGGFQFAEIRAERARLNADKAAAEVASLTTVRDSLKGEVAQYRVATGEAKQNYAKLSDQLTKAVQGSQANPALKTILQNVNAADIDLRASLPSAATQEPQPGRPQDAIIEDLFGASASTRGAAYEELMAHYAKSQDLVPHLLQYAQEHLDNLNGIYNTLVVLSHLDLRDLGADIPAIRSFAERTRGNGAKTSERVDKLISRLPH